MRTFWIRRKNIKAKTWTSRAQLLIDIFNINNDLLRKGMDQTEAKLFYKEPKEIVTTQEGGDKVEVFVYDRVDLNSETGPLKTGRKPKRFILIRWPKPGKQLMKLLRSTPMAKLMVISNDHQQS